MAHAIEIFRVDHEEVLEARRRECAIVGRPERSPRFGRSAVFARHGRLDVRHGWPDQILQPAEKVLEVAHPQLHHGAVFGKLAVLLAHGGHVHVLPGRHLCPLGAFLRKRGQ
eukprot:4011666-Prymnesium_polylepis.1